MPNLKQTLELLEMEAAGTGPIIRALPSPGGSSDSRPPSRSGGGGPVRVPGIKSKRDKSRDDDSEDESYDDDDNDEDYNDED